MTEEPQKPQWVVALEAKWGLPLHQIPGAVYAICYDPPYIAQSVSRDYAGSSAQHNYRGYLAAGPIRHYVGWTQQADPLKRAKNHHMKASPATITILDTSATMQDEERLKREGVCHLCGGLYVDSLVL